MIHQNKCVIIGCGSVGTATALTLIDNPLFSTIVLIDKDKELAEGQAMDLNHAAAFGAPVRILAGTYADINDAEIVIIAAGANQKPGQSRLDLLKDNLKVIKSIFEKIDFTMFEGVLIMATNPVDALTYAATELAPIPPWRIIGTGTVLDCYRLRYEIANLLDVSPENINALVIGEHGDSEVVVRTRANIGGVRMKEFCGLQNFNNTDEEIGKVIDKTVNSAQEIIKRKGSTCFGIAKAIFRIIRAIVRNEQVVLTVSTRLDGDYELYNVALSVPCIVGASGIEAIVPVELSYDDKEALNNSAAQIRKALTK